MGKCGLLESHLEECAGEAGKMKRQGLTMMLLLVSVVERTIRIRLVIMKIGL